ncbi:MAG: DUF5612 domain-containing protein [Fimbriimonadaceae bacterium]
MAHFGLSVVARDRTGLLRDLAGCVAARGADISATHVTTGVDAELYLEIDNLEDSQPLCDDVTKIAGVLSVRVTAAAGAVFGKRVIVIGGGAQVAQVVSGAVSEADRHNIRGERISVDTIPLVGEEKLAEAVRAVARLPRARVLVLAGSLMGGAITQAVIDLQAQGIPVICLNMAGSVVDAASLVVSDPVQAGVMAVMAVAETAKFDLERVRGRRF